jgi:hypothetical protein
MTRDPSCTCVGECSGDPRAASCQGLPAHATPDRAALAEFLRNACVIDHMTDEEIAEVLDQGDDYDQMAARLLEDFEVRRRV